MGSSNKTKDWLKNQLVSHGVPLPSSTAKKEEYQRLYEEQVLPKQNNTEFSSDDDTEEATPQDTPTRSASVTPNGRPDTKTQNGNEGSTDKRTTWVLRLSDRNLFTALTANGREIGGIAESTRLLYQNMLVDLLKKDEQKTLNGIEAYLSENEEAKRTWLDSGVELNGGFNGVGVTNGNSENGYSDTDDDETVETASRASRSSRASSKRMTPIRSSAPSLPVKESTPTLRTLTDSNVKSRRGVRDDVLEGINEVDDDHHKVTASSSRSPLMSDSLLYNRVSSSPSDSYGKLNKPFAMRKHVVETVEKTRTFVYEGESSEDVDSHSQNRTAPLKTGGSQSRVGLWLKYLLLLVTVVAVPVISYVFLVQPENSSNCTGSECASDELDVLLQSLDEQEPATAVPSE